MNDLEIPFTEEVGEAAFYGPKVDINAKNVYGKEDTMITIQWDAFNAELFDMTYIDQNGDKVRPYIIHRTSIGCYERTLAWLIEKYSGLFPTWLCPEQVRVLPISDKYMEYAGIVEKELKANGILCSVDERAEKIGYKIDQCDECQGHHYYSCYLKWLERCGTRPALSRCISRQWCLPLYV